MESIRKQHITTIENICTLLQMKNSLENMNRNKFEVPISRKKNSRRIELLV
jgi:hypothetical protein